MDAVVLMPGEGERIEAAGAAGVLKAGAETTGGAFSMSEVTLAPGFAGPPPHLHREMTDTFYVLEGQIRVLVGEEWIDAPAGAFVAAPPGTVHTFANPGDAPARLLNINSPGGWERYLRDLAALLQPGASIDQASFAQLAERHDLVVPG